MVTPRGGLLAAAAAVLTGLIHAPVAHGAASPPAPPPPVAALAAGVDHTCALLEDGTVWCWGNNEAGQLGTGNFGGPSLPAIVEGIAGATAVVAGGSHTCALLEGGAVTCWGANVAGHLGTDMDMEVVGVSSPVRIEGIAGATALAAGGTHACALLRDGTVRCWGANLSGQLGVPPSPGSSRPVGVPGISAAAAIAAGALHTCALLRDGTVRCWGANLSSQVGDGTTTRSAPPVRVAGISAAAAIAAGGFHTCALLAAEKVKCWGENDAGQLANGVNILKAPTPVTVAGIATAAAVATGLAHTCVLLTDGTARCAGANGSGQLGDGGGPAESSDPVPVTNLAGAVAIAAGGNHTCTLLGDGRVRCWGANECGQLANGRTLSSASPVEVDGLRRRVSSDARASRKVDAR